LWISTDKGLLRLTSWDGKQALFEDISSLVGQAGKAIGGNIQQDRAGRIWTKEIMLDPQRMQMRPISRVDGMDIGASWLGSYAQTRDGLLLYGGAQGLAIIDPARLANYDYAPALVITELKINGQVQAPGSLLQPGSKLTLSPQQRTITLEFAALDLAEPRKNRYQYRLQGYDKEWIEADADHRSANYGNLWPGRYTLQIRGSNRMGVFSKQELALHLQVLPAWWQSIWFGLLLLLALLGLIVALVQLRTRYLRQRQLLLEQQVQAATRELRQKQSELVAANASLSLSVDTLLLLGDIGREITANLEADIVFQSLYLYVGGLLNAPTMTIYRINSAGTLLEAVFGREGEQPMQMRNIALDSPTSTAARVVRERQELLLNFDKLDDANHIPGTRKMHSALFAPLIVGEQVLGVMSIQSDQIHAYGERECLIFRTLCAYGAIAMANATAIAALREAQAQLVQKEKMASLGGLVAGIAHEINTPLGTTLTAISGTADAWHTLQDASSSGRLNKSILSASTKEGIEYCELALHAATRAAELIKVFKSISVQAGNDYPVQVKLAEYLPEVLALLQTPLDQSGCQLQLEVGPDLSLRVVPEALTEALTRILVNVFDHAFDDGRQGSLLITADVLDAEWALISISDNGVGIAPADLPKVFDPFFTTKSGIQHHVGLGLHVSYNQITQRLGGKISISSQLGQGTRVEIRLPRT
ncbi:MAG: hypothetical protein RL748_1882, partial [Pseudomonadota bacterium]